MGGDIEKGVAPFAGAWIEIRIRLFSIAYATIVAPFAGAWIEIRETLSARDLMNVAPFAGAWIEMLSA